MTSFSKLAGTCVVLCLIASCDQQSFPLDAASPATESAMSQPVVDSNDKRIVIRTADLKLSVDHLPGKVNEIRNLTNQLNGRVFHYEVNANRQFRQETAFSLDSAFRVYDVHPEGFIKIKIPVAYADSFIHSVLAMRATIDQLTLDDEDITEDLLAKQELIAPNLPVGSKPKKLDEQQYRDERAETMIARKAELNKLNYRSAFLWFDVHLNGEPCIEKQVVCNSRELRTPLYLDAYKAIQDGWYGLGILLIAVLHLWPVMLLASVVLFAYKKRWRKLFPLRYTPGK